MDGSKDQNIQVWDLPVRLFHWALVLLVVNAFIMTKIGDPLLKWHQVNGQAILTLLLFRLIWGIVGSETARFRSFVRGPKAVLHYLGNLKHGDHGVGHNPAGALMVLALLVLLFVQGICGLFADDEILVRGPLALLVDHSTRGTLTGIHVKGYWVISGFVVLHVGAILFYRIVLKKNLVAAMITGNTLAPAQTKAPAQKSIWLALFCLCLSAGLVWSVIKWLP